MSKISKQLLLVCLLSLTVLSVQLIQHSPLHDHSLDVMDCAVCQLDFNENGALVQNVNFTFEASTSVYIVFENLFIASSVYHPYQGRSPPVSLS
jgi:hypothetical protein